MEGKKLEFLQKLHDLLAEYDAFIAYRIEGDTHGIEDNIYIDMGEETILDLPFDGEVSAGVLAHRVKEIVQG